MNQNPNIPQLFRDIFKNAYLPYRDPETLKSFLKEINEFTYDHSEQLGDAFEYLLSVMDSQGDAGQFRTPRHIIDFIVEIVEPKKNETVLDPACGTAGFLISSYKHILKSNTKKRNGDQLTPDERKRLLNNFMGYDISPDMVRLSLVNMYLHGFSDPKIVEYDTLTSEERWNETADVMLANPPFMTPKGGIRPHKRFSIKAKRSEVLFVDYIAEHLNPHGRAGVIIPEGIIFQSGKAYKNLRKMLVEDYLWAVVSLPPGVFNPYAGVKTSILLMDKTLAKKTNKILFVKIENDGFDLGAQRRPIDNNDLPQAIEFIKNYQRAMMDDGEVEPTDFAHLVEKTKISKSGDWNLSGERYRVYESFRSERFDWVKLKSVATVSAGNSAPQGNKYFVEGQYPFFRTSDVGSVHISTSLKDVRDYLNDKVVGESRLKLYPQKTILFPKSGASTFLNHRVMLGVDGYVSSHLATIVANIDRIIPEYLFHLLCKIDARNLTENQNYPSLRLKDIESIEIPLPSLDVQKAIVAEIDDYHKIIDGARQVVNNYKPTIKIDPDWEMVAIGDYFESTKLGLVKKKGEQNDEYPYVKMENITNSGYLDLSKVVYVEAKDSELKGNTLNSGDFIYNTRNAPNLVGKCTVYHGENGKYLFNNNILRIRFKDGLNSDFVNYYLNSKEGKAKVRRLVSGTTSVAAIYQKNFATITVPVPPLSVQLEIVAQIQAEQEMVVANKKLIEIFEWKIKDKILEVWEE